MTKKRKINTLSFTLISTAIFLSGDLFYSFYNTNYSFVPNHKNILYPLLLFLTLAFVQKIRLKLIILFIIMSFSLIHLFYFQYFGNYIQPVAFMQFFQNSGEVFESFLPELKYMIVPSVITIIIFIALVFTARKFHDKIFYFKFSSLVFFLALFFHALLMAYHLYSYTEKLEERTARSIYPTPNRHSFENFMRSVNCFAVGVVPKLLSGNVADFPDMETPVLVDKGPDRNIIFIIGESLRYDKLSLFGYKNKTTPFLDSLAVKDTITFKPVFAGGTMTRTALAVLLNRLKYPGAGSQLITYSSNIFKLAKDNGFTTHFISRQSYKHLEIVDNLLCRPSIDHYANKDDLVNQLDDSTGYDEDLVTKLKEIDLSSNNFIILHQRGSHTPFNKQYPEDFKIFKNSYDNTVLFTDHLLSEIYTYLKDHSLKETYLIFTSDHGEMLGEVKGKKGHGWFEKEVYTVPYLFIPINTAVSHIEDRDRIQSHFDISTKITSLLGYDTELEEKTERKIYVNGSEMNALGGYMILTTQNGVVVSTEIIN